jgi:hypothetical protein
LGVINTARIERNDGELLRVWWNHWADVRLFLLLRLFETAAAVKDRVAADVGGVDVTT